MRVASLLRARIAPAQSDRRLFGPPPLLLRFAAVLAVPIFFYGLYATGLKALDNDRLAREALGIRSEVVRLREENLRLQASLNDARTDAAIEAIAREQLGLVKPGDNALVLLAPGGPRAATPRAPLPPPAPADAATWRRWWNLFFGDRAEP